MEFPSVSFSPSQWMWTEVITPVVRSGFVLTVSQMKLLLVNLESGAAVYAGIGDDLRCQILDKSIIEGRIVYRRREAKYFVEVRRVGRMCGKISDANCQVDNFMQIEGIDGADIDENIYFVRGNRSIRARRVDVEVEGEDRAVNVLELENDPHSEFGPSIAFELPTVEKIARTLDNGALCGEIRRGFRLDPPDESGRYFLDPNDKSKLVAIKVIHHSLGVTPTSTVDLDPEFAGKRENPMTEIKVMDLIARTPNRAGSYGHPNIMQFLDVLADDQFGFVVMPFMAGGDMCDNPPPLSEHAIRACLRQIGSAVAFMHNLGICNCDISLENVLVDLHTIYPRGVPRIVLCDFGQARWHPMRPFQLLPPKVDPYRLPPGKSAYYCPEDTDNAPYSGILVDIWQLGGLIIQLCTQSPPFVDPATYRDWHDAVERRDFRTREETGSPVGASCVFPPEFAALAQRALHVDPQQRPTIHVLLARYLDPPGLGLEPAVDAATLQVPPTTEPPATASAGEG